MLNLGRHCSTYSSMRFVDDSTYMEKESDLQEYVLNDVGCIYNGNAREIGAKPWNFGQVTALSIFVTWQALVVRFTCINKITKE